MQECVDRVGWPYGMWQLFGMGVVRLINAWFDIQISNPFSDGKRTQVCSELAGHVLYKLGAPVELNKLEYEGPRYINQVVRGMVDSGSARRIF